jgi:aryl-alcohol dehydrogenase-like predicted oxidoreductase
VQFYWWDPDGIPGYLETAEVLNQLKQSGKIRHIGLTNFNTRQIKLIVERGVPILTNQIQYSPIDTRPEKELIPFCKQENIHQLCYGTLAGGFFSSQWLETEEPFLPFSNRSLTKYKLIIEDIGGWQHFQKILKGLSKISKKHHANLAQTALAWTLGQSGVGAVIIGATSTRHLAENLKVFDFSLDAEDHNLMVNLIQQSNPLEGDCFDLERIKNGRHGSIMRYNENRN